MTPDKDTHRILVVDDHAIVRHGLAALLAREKDLVICGEAGTYEEGLAAIDSLKPDILIADITLKDRSGLELIREAQARQKKLITLVLSMHDEATHAEKALRAGAQGYLMKENADANIVDAIRTVLRGEMYVSPETSSRMLRDFVGNEQGDETGIGALTERELEIFQCLGRGMSSREIADRFELSPRTVEVHRAHIKKKLGSETTAHMLREAVRWVEGGAARTDDR
ncbi:MAG TPA: response regulator transcription factor [Kiritimatiellia bacterium]